MINAIGRLALIAAVSLILILFAVFFVRWLGFQQTFAAPPHPWFANPYWHVYQPTCDQELSPPSDAWMVQISVHWVEEEWRLDCDKKKFSLAEILKTSSHPNWILKIKATDSLHLDKLVETVSPHDKEKKFAIASDSQRVSRFLRKKAPQWLYAADPASLLRMQMFTSLWIETAMDFWPDFVLTSQDVSRPAHLNLRLARELERRHKRIIWDEEGGDEKPEFPIHGIVTTRPSR